MSPTRPSIVAVVLAVALVAVPVAVAGAPDAPGGLERATSPLHGNHVSIDAQQSDDGTVVAETAASLASAFLVVRADDGGTPGEPLGHTYLNGTAFRTDVAVSLEAAAWSDVSGNRTLWAVVHLDDGDGEFDPATDRSAATRNPAARQSFALGRGDGPTHVLARQFDPLTVRDGSVTVRRVSLASEGYVVAKPYDSDDVLGTRHLAAGTHTNVSVPVDTGALDDHSGTFRLRLVAYRDDGDGTFGDGDHPVRVAGDPVETDALARVVAGGENVTTRPLVVTPSPSPTPGSTSTGATRTPTERGTVPAPSTTAPTGATGPGPGIGLAVLVVVLTVGSLVAGRRRR